MNDLMLPLAYAGLAACMPSWWPLLSTCDPLLVPHLRVTATLPAPPARKMGIALHTERVAPAALAPPDLYAVALAAAALARSAGRVAVVVSVEMEGIVGTVCMAIFPDGTMGQA